LGAPEGSSSPRAGRRARRCGSTFTLARGACGAAAVSRRCHPWPLPAHSNDTRWHTNVVNTRTAHGGVGADQSSRGTPSARGARRRAGHHSCAHRPRAADSRQADTRGPRWPAVRATVKARAIDESSHVPHNRAISAKPSAPRLGCGTSTDWIARVVRVACSPVMTVATHSWIRSRMHGRSAASCGSSALPPYG
jgi:hypothetical protein